MPINDLRLPDGSFTMWKFADDTTVSDIVPPSKQSALQQAVDFISTWSQDNRLQLNPSKCKELQSCIIFPYASYNSALKEAGIPSLYDRQASLSFDLFNDIVLDTNHKLTGLLHLELITIGSCVAIGSSTCQCAKQSALKNLLLLAIA